jgi:DNA-binding transcriptional regulator YiaG
MDFIKLQVQAELELMSAKFNLSDSKLAKAYGVSEKTLKSWKQGLTVPSGQNLKKFAVLF